MRTLTIKETGSVWSDVMPTVRVTPKQGDPFYLCNPMDEVIEAIDSHEPFVAHVVAAMQPKRAVLMPGSIAKVEEV